MKWLGIGFLAAYLITLIYFPEAILSIWCYFSATISIVVLWILKEATIPSHLSIARIAL